MAALGAALGAALERTRPREMAERPAISSRFPKGFLKSVACTGPGYDPGVGGFVARGGAEGDRTPDLLIANEALSQLSYSPTPRRRPDNADPPQRSQGRPRPRFPNKAAAPSRLRIYRRRGLSGATRQGLGAPRATSEKPPDPDLRPPIRVRSGVVLRRGRVHLAGSRLSESPGGRYRRASRSGR